MKPRPLSRGVTYAFLIAAALLMIAPFLWSISTSLKQPGDVFAYPPRFLPDPVTFQNYVDVFTKLTFGRYFLNSVIVTGSVVILNVLFGTAAAYAFAKLRFPGRDAIFFLLLLSLSKESKEPPPADLEHPGMEPEPVPETLPSIGAS